MVTTGNHFKGHLRYKTKICDAIIDIVILWKLQLCLFLLNPKCYQNETWPNTSVLLINISNMFLAQCWRLETSSRSFIILLKRQNSEIWPFLIADIYHFQMSFINLFKKMKHWNLDIISYGVIGAGC